MTEPRLRLTQTAITEHQYRIDVRYTGADEIEQESHSELHFTLTEDDQKNLQWYLEDYLQHPIDPAPTIAKRIEKRMEEIGEQLFRDVLQGDDDSREIWTLLKGSLADARVEIITEIAEASTIPWELLRDPRTDVYLALRAKAFVRTYARAAQRPQVKRADDGVVRILLVICRPGADDDVPFRSVASKLIKGLPVDAREHFQLDVLRPPTFAALDGTLREAKRRGTPYHVVHFDGHGAYIDKPEDGGTVTPPISSMLYGSLRDGKHGYLLFENTAMPHNIEFVHGEALGKLMVEHDVPVLVLNACRSAHAEPPEKPEETEVPEQVHAFGSLAQQVMHTGVSAVVAMRYNVYVVTAAQFVADLYGEIAKGTPLGEAVTVGRKQLNLKNTRTIAYSPIALQDWVVPVIYEAGALDLFPKRQLTISTSLEPKSGIPERGFIDRDLPREPDVGFYGGCLTNVS